MTTRLLHLFALRLGAKCHIAFGVIGVFIGIYFAWGLLHAFLRSYAASTNPNVAAAPVSASYLIIYLALTFVFLFLGLSRIRLGLRSDKKHWFEDPFRKR